VVTLVTVIVTFRIDGQWLWDHAIKFVTWQHLAMGHGARFAVPDTPCDYVVFSYGKCNADKSCSAVVRLKIFCW